MKFNKFFLIVFGIVFLSFLSSAWLFPQLPERMAVHWNFSGSPDGFSGKFFGAFFLPSLIAVMALIFAIIPKIDPLNFNFENFRKEYDGFVVLLLLFMLGVHFFSIAWNLGFKINLLTVLPVGLGVLFYYVGILCGKAERNWFVGIRTPWTLSSEIVWNKTNKLGGKLFKIAGIISILGIFFGQFSFFLAIIPIILFSLYLIAYSFAEFKKQQKPLELIK